MISSKNIIFIFFLPSFFNSMMSIYGITKCEENILTDFEVTNRTRFDVKRDMPRRAFLKKTINDLTKEDAIRYFEHLHEFLSPKRSMLLPREFCDVNTHSLKLHGEDEYEKCVEQITSTFKDTKDRTELLKSTFWNFTENIISRYDKKDYRYKYYYHLGGKLIYYTTNEKKLPMTLREFCSTLYADRYINLMSRDVLEFTREEAIAYCATKIFNDFGITLLWQQHKARKILPKAAFLSFSEDDLESPDAKDYYYHMYTVIKAKDGTENPRRYCKTITKEIEEEKICVRYLLSMYLDSDATTVLKDVFQNYKKSDFVKIKEADYRVRYYHYLSGCYDFYKISSSRNTPVTPKEFCTMDRTDALNPGIIMESKSINGEESSSSAS